MGLLVASMFLGVSALAVLFNIDPVKEETLVSLVARTSLGGNAFYYVVQLSTLLILAIAANTSFAAFPRISSRLAADSFLPKPLANLGDRLVFSNGVLLLAGLSILLILFFQGNTHHLLPLYAIGVFIGFSLTQAGMAVRWWRQRGRNWLRAFLTNGFGACATGVVLLVITVGKFTLGAWMVAIAIPLMLMLFIAIRRHYDHVAEALSLEHYVSPPSAVGNVVIVPIGGVNRSVLPAIEYAQRIGTTVRAVHIASDEDGARATQHRWARLQNDIPLIVIPSPYREVVGPLVSYIMEVVKSHPSEHITVVIPEFVPRRWWQRLLHNQTAFLLKLALYFERRVIVTNVPYHLSK